MDQCIIFPWKHAVSCRRSHHSRAPLPWSQRRDAEDLAKPRGEARVWKNTFIDDRVKSAAMDVKCRCRYIPNSWNVDYLIESMITYSVWNILYKRNLLSIPIGPKTSKVKVLAEGTWKSTFAEGSIEFPRVRAPRDPDIVHMIIWPIPRWYIYESMISWCIWSSSFVRPSSRWFLFP